MKKQLIYFIILILLANIVLAETIFDQTVTDNIPFSIEGIEHMTRYYPSAKKVSIMAGTERLLVSVADCEELGEWKYCVDSAETNVVDETGDSASTVHLRVLEAGPDVSIERSMTTDEPELNEEIEITVVLTNNGNERASNINLEDNFPSKVRISSMYKNTLKNGIIWVGSLNPGQSETIKYKVKFMGFVTFDSKAEASVLYKDKLLKSESDTTQIEVKKPYGIADSISARTVDVNEEIIYTLSLNNSDTSRALEVNSIEISVPNGAVISRRDKTLNTDGNKLTFSGSIPPSGSETFSVRFKSGTPVKGKLVTTASINAGSETILEEFSYNIGLGVAAIFPEIKFTPSTVKGGMELEIDAKLTNTGEKTISDISIDLASDLVGPKGWRSIELEPGNSHNAFTKIINAPASDEEKTYFLKLSGSYLTQSGKTMKFSSQETVTVLAQEKLVELTPEIRVEGSDINITVKVKNVAPYKVAGISLIDTLPKGFKSTGGDRYIDIEEMSLGEELTAYSYLIKVPSAFRENSFEITHIFNGIDKEGDKIMTERKTIVQIDPSKLSKDKQSDEEDTTDNKENKKTESEQQTEEENKEKETTTTDNKETKEAEQQTEEDKDKNNSGMFSRMWSWFKGLFS
jgi:uncharacterized repeat protein (TIGR01451 family)